MTESFAALFEESELNLNVEKGAVIQGVVVSIDSDWVTVDTGTLNLKALLTVLNF